MVYENKKWSLQKKKILGEKLFRSNPLLSPDGTSVEFIAATPSPIPRNPSEIASASLCRNAPGLGTNVSSRIV
jgi:hypothetical protein